MQDTRDLIRVRLQNVCMIQLVPFSFREGGDRGADNTNRTTLCYAYVYTLNIPVPPSET